MGLEYAPALRTDPFFKIEITHMPTNRGQNNGPVTFEGWVTEFSDQFASNWNKESVYGRMDPLATFQNTQRTISLGFDVVSDSREDAWWNLAKVNRLIEFLYPVYESEDTANHRNVQNVMKAPPLWGLKWTNLIGTPSTNKFLVGFVEGFNYAPDIGDGGFIDAASNQLKMEGSEFLSIDAKNPETGESGPTGAGTHVGEQTRIFSNQYIPKTLNISFSFTVLHTHLPGWYMKEGSYYFGSEDIDGKFPNAGYVATYKQSETVVTDIDVSGSVISEETTVNSLVYANQEDLLGGG